MKEEAKKARQLALDLDDQNKAVASSASVKGLAGNSKFSWSDASDKHTTKELPDGWKWTTIGEISQVNLRDPLIRELPEELPVTFVPMAAVNAEVGMIDHPEVRPLKDVRKGFTSFSNGDVIFAKITPCMENGKAAIACNLQNGRGFGSTEFHVIRPTNIVLDFRNENYAPRGA